MTSIGNNSKIYFNVAVITGFTITSVIGIFHHEIWLDEAHHWLLARDSNDLFDLIHNARYEGHPLLWNLILFVFTRCASNVVGMQIINVIISITALSLFIFYAPFNNIQKLLFTLGNFILYEYTVISRNYALLICLLFLSVILYIKKKDVALGCVLFLLVNTHLFGLMLAFGLVMMWIFEILIQETRQWNKNILIGLSVCAMGALISILQILPPLDSTWYQSIHKSNEFERLARTSTVFLKGFFPVSDFTDYHFWNTNLLMNVSKPLCAAISLALLLYPLACFKRQTGILLFFYAVACPILIFFYLSDLNAPRYYGIIYMLFVTATWLSKASGQYLPDHSKMFFASILYIQMIAGLINYTIDLKRPFSESKKTASFLKTIDNAAIISGGCGAAPIVAYLERKIFYLTNQRYGSFCSFNRKAEAVAADEKWQRLEALKFARSSPLPVYYITHSLLHLSFDSGDFKLLAIFNKSALRKENFYVYRVIPGEAL